MAAVTLGREGPRGAAGGFSWRGGLPKGEVATGKVAGERKTRERVRGRGGSEKRSGGGDIFGCYSVARKKNRCRAELAWRLVKILLEIGED